MFTQSDSGHPLLQSTCGREQSGGHCMTSDHAVTATHLLKGLNPTTACAAAWPCTCLYNTGNCLQSIRCLSRLVIVPLQCALLY